MELITLYITGGTIDKVYNEFKGGLSFQQTQLNTILNQARSTVNLDVQELMLVDSLKMSSKQRTAIVNLCKKNENSKIVITHGTDSMVATATEIAKENLDKTIVITGAMIPYTISNSDALFNMGSALSYVQSLPNGVYIAMNGNYFPWNNVRKNKELGVFEKL